MLFLHFQVLRGHHEGVEVPQGRDPDHSGGHAARSSLQLVNLSLTLDSPYSGKRHVLCCTILYTTGKPFSMLLLLFDTPYSGKKHLPSYNFYLF